MKQRDNSFRFEGGEGCLGLILRIFGFRMRGTSSVESSPYRRKEYLLSKAESSFYGVLTQAVEGQFVIFAKVRVADILYLPRGTERWQAHFNRVQSKHVDFVLCHRNGIQPCMVIELNDSSHHREDRSERDSFLKAAFRGAGLPFLVVPARASYNVRELRQEILAKALPGE